LYDVDMKNSQASNLIGRIHSFIPVASSSIGRCPDVVNRPGFYGAKRAILGEVVTEVNARGGGLRLSKDWSRAVKVGEIHEIMVTGSELSPGDELHEFTAVAFFEVSQGSHSVIGDKLYLNEAEGGSLWGMR